MTRKVYAGYAACCSESRTGKLHPYYLCHKKGCVSRGKSIRREVVESDFCDILHSLRPKEKLFQIAKMMFKDAWTQRRAMRQSW
jgi:hypothetical protein